MDKDWLDLVRKIESIFAADEADGIVSRTAPIRWRKRRIFLNLTLKTDKPVVIVGAMRPSSALAPTDI